MSRTISTEFLNPAWNLIKDKRGANSNNKTIGEAIVINNSIKKEGIYPSNLDPLSTCDESSLFH